MADIVPCEPNTKCLDEVQAAIGEAAGLSGVIKDRVSGAVKRFCNNPAIDDNLKKRILRAAARPFVDSLHGKMREIGAGIAICLGTQTPKVTVGGWLTQVLNVLKLGSNNVGGSEAYLSSVVRRLTEYYNTDLLTNFCSDGGLKDMGQCATLSDEAACFKDLAPWLVGSCLTKAGFTESDLFIGSDNTYAPRPEHMNPIIIACNGLTLAYEIIKDETIDCHGVLEYELYGGGYTTFVIDQNGDQRTVNHPPISFLKGTKPYKTVSELNGHIKAVAEEVKPKAKEQLRKSYELMWSQIEIAYNNRLKFLRGLKGAVTYNMKDGLALIVDHVLGELGANVSCSAEAQAWWATNGGGSDTDACFNKLKDTTVPFEDSVAPKGRHRIPITEPEPGATEVDVPLPGGGGFKKMPWPPTPGPIWDSYVLEETQQQPDAHGQCASARKVEWAWNPGSQQIDIRYIFNPSAAWATNTGLAQAIAECQLGKNKGGKIAILRETMTNLAAIFNKTRGPCGQSPLYSLISALSPEVGNNQYLGFDPSSCSYVVPGPGFTDNPDRGGEWPPANQPGNPGGAGLPLPDDCKFYPIFTTTAERQKLGLILPVLRAVLDVLSPVAVKWDKTKAEIETWIKKFEETVDKACS